MKKLTLMLCACAMALAMVLVSCKNEPEEYVDVTSHSYDYIYKVTGTVKQVTEYGPKDGTLTTTTITKTYTKATGAVSGGTESSTSKPDYIYYTISVNGIGDQETKTGDSDPVKMYKVDISPNWVFKYLYKMNGKYYVQDYWGAAYTEVTVSDIKKDGFTYVGSYTEDNTSDTYVNKTTYSVDLKFEKIN